MRDTPFRLEVLGGVDLRRRDETPLRSILAQPKRIALLAYVAVEGGGGFVARDRVMAVLWPESDQDRARQSLRNGLYKIRQAAGDDILVNRGPGDVGIDPSLLAVDVLDLQAAVSEGRFAEAVALYQGPFLPGFHLDGCPGFEEWAAGVRAELERDAVAALREAARAREGSGDPETARSFLRRALDVATADEEVLREYLTLLVRLGNRATAITEGRAWAEDLRTAFGVEPSRATQGLLEDLEGGRAPAADEPLPVARVAALPTESVAAPTGATYPPIAAGRPGAAPRATRSGGRARDPSRGWARGWWLVGPVVAMVLALAWALAPEPVELPAAEAGVVVQRFAVEGVPDGEAIGYALAALTARRLDARGGGLVLAHEGLAAATLDGVERRLVVGRVRGDGDSLVAEITLTTTARPDAVLASARAGIDHMDLEALAVRLVEELAVRSRQPLGAGEAVPPLSAVPAAIIPFFQGEILLEGGRRAEALDVFQRAVALDSAFAMAYFRLSVVREALGLREEALEVSDRAVALSARMTDGERRVVDAWRVLQWGVVEQALPLFEALVAARGPDRAAWTSLAEIHFHWGPQLGVPRVAADSAWARVVALAPGDADALLHRIRLMTPTASRAEMEGALAQLYELEPGHPVRAEAEALDALGAGEPPSEAIAAWATDGSYFLESRRLTQLAASTPRPADLATFVRSLPPTEEPHRQVLRRLLLAQLAAEAGRMREARAELDTLGGSHPARALEYRIFLELASPVPAPDDTLRVLRDRLRAVPGVPPSSHGMIDVAEPGIYPPRARVLEAMLGRRLGETIDTTDLHRRGRAATPNYDPDYAELVRLERMAAEGSLERYLGRLGPGRPEWHRARPDPLSYLAGASRRTRAGALIDLGRDDEALRWLGTYPDVGGYDLVYVAETALLSGEALERLGRRAEAVSAFRRTLTLWADADPEFDELVDRARRGLERTGGLTPSP